MSLYGHDFIKESSFDEELEGLDLTPYVQLVAYDDISRGTTNQIREFCESELATVLTEKSVLTKPTLMRLSKADDEKRRTKLIAYQLAKEAKDPAWKKMVKYRQLMKEQKAIIMKKYGKKAGKIAKSSQKEYIKVARKAPNGKASLQNTELGLQ